MQQAGRRSKRNAEDQSLILALQDQVDAEHNRAESMVQAVQHLNNQVERIRELEATSIRQEKAIEVLRSYSSFDTRHMRMKRPHLR